MFWNELPKFDKGPAKIIQALDEGAFREQTVLKRVDEQCDCMTFHRKVSIPLFNKHNNERCSKKNSFR